MQTNRREQRFLSAVGHKRSWWLVGSALMLALAVIQYGNWPAVAIDAFLAAMGVVGFYSNLWGSRNRHCAKCHRLVFCALGIRPNAPPKDCPKSEACGIVIQS